MLLVVSPNLAVDRILEVDGFRSSAVQRSRSVFTQPGGKGSNVARVFRQLGGDVVVSGFVGTRNSGRIVEPLRALGIQVDTIEGYSGENRTCTIICDSESSSHPTVVNEESPEITPGAAAALLAIVDNWLGRAEAVLVTGSLSSGLSPSFYKEVISRGVARGLFTAIDATGAALREGLQARPALMKCNLEEVATVVGPVGVQPRDIVECLRCKTEDLASQTIVTLGEAGSVLVHGRNAWYAVPPRISVTNPIGAGDAFAAGYIKAFLDGLSSSDALGFATACAASDAATIQPGSVVAEEISALASATSVLRW